MPEVAQPLGLGDEDGFHIDQGRPLQFAADDLRAMPF